MPAAAGAVRAAGLLLAAAGAWAVPTVGTAQAPAARATLVVTRSGVETSREAMAVETRAGGGTTVAIEVRPAPGAPGVGLTATLDQGPSGELERLVVDGHGPEGPIRVLAAASGSRLVVRTLAGGTESAAQLPAGAVVVEPRSLGLVAALARRAGPAPATVVAIDARTGARGTLTLTRTGDRVELAGMIDGVVTLLDDGLPTRVELPGSGIVAVRSDR